MKRIGLTQRVEVVTAYKERRDCLDQNWIKLMQKLGFLPILLPNLQVDGEMFNYLEELSLEGVILTGGNDLAWTQSNRAAKERDDFESSLIDFCDNHNLPILGVCRGMQLLNIHFGGQLQPVNNHVTPSHLVTFKNGEKYQVNSYHDWGFNDELLASKLVALGHSSDGLVEYCKHKNKQITGMMWHPERTNDDQEIGHQIIKETFL